MAPSFEAWTFGSGTERRAHSRNHLLISGALVMHFVPKEGRERKGIAQYSEVDLKSFSLVLPTNRFDKKYFSFAECKCKAACLFSDLFSKL